MASVPEYTPKPYRGLNDKAEVSVGSSAAMKKMKGDLANISLPSKGKVDKEIKASKSKVKLSQKLKKSVIGKGDHVGRLKYNIFDLAKSLDNEEGVLRTKINKLSGTKKSDALYRLAELKEMITYARVLEQDQFKDYVVNELVNYRLELKEAKISEQFPSELVTLTKTAMMVGRFVDKEGKSFDNLRTPDDKFDLDTSITTQFNNFCGQRGGDYNLIKTWYTQQGGNSWCDASRVVKHKIASYRDVPSHTYWYKPMTLDGEEINGALSQAQYQKLLKREFKLNDDAQLDSTLLMFIAFNMEFLTHTKLPETNLETGTIKVYRTEGKEWLKENNITKPDDKHEFDLQKGSVESGSISHPYAFYGHCVTEQDVPFHRIIATYLTEKIYNDIEREVLCLFDGIKCKYTQDI